MMKILLLFVCCYFDLIKAHEPVSPAEWVKLAGGGFTTSWFRSLEGYETRYQPKVIQDVYDKGFTSLRLRCRTGYPNYDMARQIRDLNKVVDDCLKVGVVPIVCWLNHKSEAEATDKQMNDYVNWWKQVALSMKGKDYRLAYNIFEEIGVEENPGPHCAALNKIAAAKKHGKHFVCPVVGGQSLRENLDKYIRWTKAVVAAIREIDPQRIIILGSPGKTGQYLQDIPSEIYSGDKYMMAEWHIYASGPCKTILKNGKKHAKYWLGNGKPDGRKNVVKNLAWAKEWTEKTGILTYFGEWMPQDSLFANITMPEAIAFTRYFLKEMKKIGVPWTLNTLGIYYDLWEGHWHTKAYKIKGAHQEQEMDWPRLLRVIQQVMGFKNKGKGKGKGKGKKNKALDVSRLDAYDYPGAPKINEKKDQGYNDEDAFTDDFYKVIPDDKPKSNDESFDAIAFKDAYDHPRSPKRNEKKDQGYNDEDAFTDDFYKVIPDDKPKSNDESLDAIAFKDASDHSRAPKINEKKDQGYNDEDAFTDDFYKVIPDDKPKSNDESLDAIAFKDASDHPRAPKINEKKDQGYNDEDAFTDDFYKVIPNDKPKSNEESLDAIAFKDASDHPRAPKINEKKDQGYNDEDAFTDDF